MLKTKELSDRKLSVKYKMNRGGQRDSLALGARQGPRDVCPSGSWTSLRALGEGNWVGG